MELRSRDKTTGDEMGICAEPADYVIGLRNFEQYIFRTQPEGARSGPGDLDVVIYSLRKWMRLALRQPNCASPTVCSGGTPRHRTDLGAELRNRSKIIVSRRAGDRFLGYLRAQRDRLLGVRGGRNVNRPELEQLYGFDTKYAMHMVRLGVQGVELLETGRISLPIREPWLSWLRQLRQGMRTKEEALSATSELEARIEQLLETSPLPASPDQDEANRWLIHAYRLSWDQLPRQGEGP